MIGLAIALLILAWDVVLCNSELKAGLSDSLNFLWYWSCVWYTFLVITISSFGTSIGAIASKSKDPKMIALAGGFVGLLSFLVVCLVLAIPAMICLGGIYIMYHANEPFDVKFTIGGIMYVISLFLMSIKSNKAD